jgi:hypothetical protein
MDPVIVRSATPDDRRAIERLLRDLPGVWQSSWRKDVVARALGASDDLAFVAVRNEPKAKLLGCRLEGGRPNTRADRRQPTTVGKRAGR